MSIPEIMQTVTQAEVNKAAHSRSYAQLDDMLMRCKIELVFIDEEIEGIEARGDKVSRQIIFNRKVIRLNIERLEKRITDLAARAEQRSMRYKDKQERYELALANARENRKQLNNREEITEARNRIIPEDLHSREVPWLPSWAKRLQDGETWADIKKSADDKKKDEYQFIIPGQELPDNLKHLEDKPLEPELLESTPLGFEPEPVIEVEPKVMVIESEGITLKRDLNKLKAENDAQLNTFADGEL